MRGFSGSKFILIHLLILFLVFNVGVIKVKAEFFEDFYNLNNWEITQGSVYVCDSKVWNDVNYDITNYLESWNFWISGERWFYTKVFITRISVSCLDSAKYIAIILPNGELEYIYDSQVGWLVDPNNINTYAVGLYGVRKPNAFCGFTVHVYYHPYTESDLISRNLTYEECAGKVIVFDGFNIMVQIIDKDGNVRTAYYGMPLDTIPSNKFPIKIKLILKRGYPSWCDYIGIIDGRTIKGAIYLDEKPYPNAKVWLYNKSSGSFEGFTYTDDNGNYIFSGLKDGTNYTIKVYSQDNYKLGEFDVRCPNTHFDIYLTSNVNLIIKVIDENNNTISGATVKIDDIEYVSDDDGIVKVFNLPMGQVYTIKAEKSGYYNFSVKYYATHLENLTIVLVSKSSGVSGVVYEEYTAKPVENVKITIGNTTIYTNSIGYYHCNITNGTYIITAEKTGYKPQNKTVNINGSAVCNFNLLKLYSVKIIAKKDGYVISNFNLTIFDSDYNKVWEGRYNGSYIKLPFGKYTFSATVNLSGQTYFGSYTCYVKDNQTVTIELQSPPPQPQRQEIIYPPQHAVTLQIVKNGVVCAGIPVVIKDPSGNTTTLTTDSYGSVVFWANKTIPYEININNGEKVLTLYPSSDYYIINIGIGGGYNFSTNQTMLNFTNITIPVPGWLRLPAEVFIILGACCIVLAGTKSSMPFALLVATILLGFGVLSGLTPHVPYPVIAVSAFITGLSFLRRGETS